jgi:tetratricopeptide (TPR) repeat protein
VIGHYDENALQEYLDDPSEYRERAALETHVAICPTCRALLEELMSLEDALGSDAVWNRKETSHREDPPESIRMLATLLAAEDEEAARLLERLLGSPASFRRANVAALPEMRTAGVVRRLSTESRALREKQPMHALVVADASISLGEQLDPVRYPPSLLAEVRGTAWLERANVLRYLGRYPEALESLDVAERMFAVSPVPAYSTAIVDYTRAVVWLETGQLADSLRMARRSARVFRQFGEDERYVHAKIVEGAVLFDQSRYRESCDLFTSLLETARGLGEAATLAGLYGNVANCQLRLNELESAESYLQRALSLYTALGLEASRIRTRWHIGCLRIAAGNVNEGLARLREARNEFEALGARSDAALVTLDIAEALLASGERNAAEEAAELCSGLVESFSAVGSTGNALTALAFLREAFAAGRATPGLVRHVRDYLETRPDQSEQPFAPPSRL